MRAAVLETIATLAPRKANFIFTHAGFDDDPEDHGIYNQIAKTAERRTALFVPVRLLCAAHELRQRVVSPDRAERRKSMDPDAAARNALTRNVLHTPHPNAMTLDITHIHQTESAIRILQHVRAVAQSSVPRLKEGN